MLDRRGNKCRLLNLCTNVPWLRVQVSQIIEWFESWCECLYRALVVEAAPSWVMHNSLSHSFISTLSSWILPRLYLNKFQNWRLLLRYSWIHIGRPYSIFLKWHDRISLGRSNRLLLTKLPLAMAVLWCCPRLQDRRRRVKRFCFAYIIYSWRKRFLDDHWFFHFILAL